jgi:hypothetical protein
VDFAPLEGLTVMSIVPAAPRPCVFPKCGHTFNQFPSTYRPSNCPTCRKEGPVTELKLRYEPRISRGPPTHVLTCGHGMSQECAQEAMERPMPRYDLDQTNDWKLPESSSKRACPFCGDLVTSQQTLYPLVELNRQ